MHAPLNQEVINDTAKRIMHRLIAQTLARDPSLVSRARLSLSAMSSRYPDRPFVAEWDELLRLPVRQLRTRLVSRDPTMTRLRLSSPFVTADGVDFTDRRLRQRIRRAARRVAARAGLRMHVGLHPTAA